MNIVIVGPGLMGAQIGVEYALGGHRVSFLARDTGRALPRVEAALDLAVQLALASEDAAAEARGRIGVFEQLDDLDPASDLVVESIVERLADKVEVLRRLAARMPVAILATNTSSLSVTAIGEGAGISDRLIGTHYWNPPLLMPLVEVIATDRGEPRIVTVATDLLTSLGKRPVVARRDVPGFIWNRMQLALLREAIWLAEHDVASPEAIDQVVREGLARRWRYTGPFQTAALGGADTFERIANNLWPVLSNADRLDNLSQWLNLDPDLLRETREHRDAGLRDDLRREKDRDRP